jgi:pyruvate dehydrogenase E2 component (dihydrolipoamide acetyltransferase)
MIKDFRLPDLGEGLPDGEIVRWTVAVGDTVTINQTIAEVETVKAAVELPSPYAGVVTALHAAEGDVVPVGAAIISIDTPEAAEVRTPVPATAPAGTAELEKPLVGYGAREERAARRRPVPVARLEETNSAPEIVPTRRASGPHRVLAKPPVRKLAKDLGVDLAGLSPSGPNGTVTRDDVRSAVQLEPSRIQGERETRIPVRGVRRAMANAMVQSAFTAPHVSEFITIDVTATMELRDRVAARKEFAGVKVTPLLFVAKAVTAAAMRTPEINARLDGDDLILQHYVNLGIAAATDRGLIVPNIKDADAMSLRELAVGLADLTEKARAGKTEPAALVGGTITITNVGALGADTGTPLLNPGESGIVAFGAINRRPWVVGAGDQERIEPRWVTTLAVSFDHRVVDGAQGTRFLKDVADLLNDPGLALL